MRSTVWMLALFSLAAGFADAILRSDPIPDTSEKCITCQSTVSELENTWTDPDSVEQILKDLEVQCRELSIAKRQICNKLVEALVQIPPALFNGMDDLAWPVPLAPCALIQQCKVPCCAADSPPEQIHLSLGGSKDSSVMGVSWVTLNQSSSIVEFGSDPNNLNIRAVGTIGTYTSAGWVGVIHRATMHDLKPKTIYHYRVGNGDSSWSDVYSFVTSSPDLTPMTYAVIADMAYDEQSDYTVSSVSKLVQEGTVQAVIHSGDISYADGYEPHWDDFFNKIQPIAAHVPYMVSPGNHEFWFNFSSYKSRFFMPGVIDSGGSGDNMYFSWEQGAVHFVSMSSETAIDVANFDEDEVAWLADNLKSVDRTRTPWLIVHFHRPMYCNKDSDCDKPATRLRSEVEALFFDFKVDLVLAGHVHSYERSYPVFDGTVVSTSYTAPGAPVYILQGASGNREGNNREYPPLSELSEWTAATSVEIGYGIMSVSSTQIDWTFYSSASGEALDHFVLSK